MPKTFFDLTQNECLENYQIIIDNSDRHLKVAKLLSDNFEYGISISHLVLSTEELVKGLIIFLDGLGLKVRKVKGVKSFFYQHKVRHSFSEMFLVMATIVRPVMEFIRRFKDLIHNPDLRNTMTELESSLFDAKRTNSKENVQKWFSEYGKSLTDKLESYLDFWEEAEQKKQNGFYVDFNETILSPGQIKESEYLEALDITLLFNEECKSLVEYLAMTPKLEINELVKLLDKDKKIYSLFETLTSSSSKSTKTAGNIRFGIIGA